MFDSQADIAAVVYAPGEDPDGLLRAFAESLRHSGYHAVGLIQTTRRSTVVQQAMSAIALPTGAPVSFRHEWAPTLAGCHLDARELAAAKARLAQAITGGAHLVIINRFGKLEASGRGFVEEIRQAVAADIPVVIAVPQHLFMPWTRFCAGMGVKLACAREALEAWWRGVAAPPHGAARRSSANFCEMAK
jgi:nucleoside-triphosphatase THEP1